MLHKNTKYSENSASKQNSKTASLGYKACFSTTSFYTHMYDSVFDIKEWNLCFKELISISNFTKFDKNLKATYCSTWLYCQILKYIIRH